MTDIVTALSSSSATITVQEEKEEKAEKAEEKKEQCDGNSLSARPSVAHDRVKSSSVAARGLQSKPSEQVSTREQDTRCDELE